MSLKVFQNYGRATDADVLTLGLSIAPKMTNNPNLGIRRWIWRFCSGSEGILQSDRRVPRRQQEGHRGKDETPAEHY